MSYTVKGVKEHKGHEGEPVMQCTLCYNGRKVAEYSGDEHGGEARFFWVDTNVERVAVKGVNFGGKAYTYMGTPEEARLSAHCAALPRRTDSQYNLGEYAVTPDTFVEELIDVALTEKWLKRFSKDRVAFRLVTDEANAYRRLGKADWDPRILPMMKERYGDKLERVIWQGTTMYQRVSA